MAIRWDDFPHHELRLKIHARLAHNAVARSTDDSLRHILQRKLRFLRAEDHRRFIELEASSLVEHLRCTRDVYQELVNAHWVVLRCAVFPTAIELLRSYVVRYARFTRVQGRHLSLLFGIPTRTCYSDPVVEGFQFLCPPDPKDETAATEAEIESLGTLVHDSLLSFRDIRDGGSVWQPYGGGPFAVDDRRSLKSSWSLCGLRHGITLIDWLGIREKWWHSAAPWTDGLVSLFTCVQEELLSQWRVLPQDSMVHMLALKRLKDVVVPAESLLPLRLSRGKECEELAEELKTIRHKRVRSGLTIDEIQADCPAFRIWKRVEVLSSEDRDTFLRPGTWEHGYENLLLGKLYATNRRSVAPGTVNTWRKEYRTYLRWKDRNSSKTPEDFSFELKSKRSSYRKTPSAKSSK